MARDIGFGDLWNALIPVHRALEASFVDTWNEYRVHFSSMQHLKPVMHLQDPGPLRDMPDCRCGCRIGFCFCTGSEHITTEATI